VQSLAVVMLEVYAILYVVKATTCYTTQTRDNSIERHSGTQSLAALRNRWDDDIARRRTYATGVGTECEL